MTNYRNEQKCVTYYFFRGYCSVVDNSNMIREVFCPSMVAFSGLKKLRE